MDELFERAGFNTSSPIPGGKTDAALVGRWNACSISSWNVCSITRHACVAAIEDWRLQWVVGPFRPVIVWLVAFVATLVSERLFICPSEVAVPGEEISLIQLVYKLGEVKASVQFHGLIAFG